MSLLSSSAVRELEAAAAARRQRATGLAAFVASAWLLDACVVEPRWLARTTHDLPSERTSGTVTPLRVAVVSDLHTAGLGFVERAAVAAVAEARPDLIAITGDVVDDGQLTRARPVLAALVATKPRLGTWAVAGNWEHWRPPTIDVATFYADLGIALLDDEARPLDANGVWIAGVDWEGSGAKALAKVPRGAPVLALVHAPGSFDDLRTRAREGDHALAVLAGHTHGGQARLPFVGALWLPPGSGPYDEGVFGDARASLFVSRGIGTSIAPLRFFCRPELPIVTVRMGSSVIRLRILATERPRRAAGVVSKTTGNDAIFVGCDDQSLHVPVSSPIHLPTSSTPASWTTDRPSSGIITAGSVERMRNIMIDSSGLPGTMSNLNVPAPPPAATGGLQMPSVGEDSGTLANK